MAPINIHVNGVNRLAAVNGESGKTWQVSPYSFIIDHEVERQVGQSRRKEINPIGVQDPSLGAWYTCFHFMAGAGGGKERVTLSVSFQQYVEATGPKPKQNQKTVSETEGTQLQPDPSYSGPRL